jgi:hypothetical protein
MRSSAPVTRICTLSVGSASTPAASTVFCVAICSASCGTLRPNCASRWCEISMKIFSSCAPNRSTLATLGTLSSCWRDQST